MSFVLPAGGSATPLPYGYGMPGGGPVAQMQPQYAQQQMYYPPQYPQHQQQQQWQQESFYAPAPAYLPQQQAPMWQPQQFQQPSVPSAGQFGGGGLQKPDLSQAVMEAVESFALPASEMAKVTARIRLQTQGANDAGEMAADAAVSDTATVSSSAAAKKNLRSKKTRTRSTCCC
eukprot:TRINITY_DN15174_c0_g2_i1.p1 TRINITY_DN15174_c0_g2~~TRINITY_DN15174_c0_g2_i1.p1  ORF type:complete len:174 (+),score=48.03 TRINITY_DN15174_c0_g2_i1:107-628(+)